MSYAVLWDTLNDKLVKLNIEGTPAIEIVALYPSLQAAEDMKTWALQNGDMKAAGDWMSLQVGSNSFEEKQKKMRKTMKCANDVHARIDEAKKRQLPTRSW